MTPHTPGPWTVDGPEIWCERDGVRISTGLSDYDLATANSNARLMAAAPELLAVLRRLLALHPDQPVGEGDARDVCDAARAAIAKATA